MAAIDDLCEKFDGLELIIIESGGDNLAATFSPELSDLTLYVIDVADLLIINKTDLAPMVGANLDVMDQDAKRMRGEKPFLFSNMKTQDGLEEIIQFIEKQGLFKA